MKTSKRILATLLAALTLFFLTACASRQSQTAAPAQTAQQPSQQETPAQNTDSNADAETPETPAQTEGPDTAEPADEQSEETSPEGGRTLVVYYSASCNTAAVAGYIADALGADTFEFMPETPYSSDDLNWTVNGSRVNREHDDESLRDIALIADSVDNWDNYDTVLIGYPIWWAIAA